MSSHSSSDWVIRPEPAPQDARSTSEPATLPVDCAEDVPVRGLPLGTRIGDFELLCELASGGMGIVYKAHQVSLDRIVALKMLQRSRPSTSRVARRLESEARIAAHLKHPNIVNVYEFGILDGHHFFSMEYVEGPSLSQRLRNGALEPKSAALYVKQIADAMEHAHRNGVLHRDLKPANILFDDKDRPVVTDFGIAKLWKVERSLTVTGQVLGTPSYMPPEQSLAENEQLDIRSDVYSLGAVLYETISGKPPFRESNPIDTMIAVRTRDPEPPTTANPSVPKDLETICLKCLEKEPAKRYATAASLADDLDRFLEGKPIHARPASRTEHAWRWIKRHPAATAAGSVTALAILIVFAGLVLFNSRLQTALEQADDARWALKQRLYWSDVQSAGDAWRDRDIALAASILEEYIPDGDDVDVRGPEWHFLWERVHMDRTVVRTSESSLYFAEFSRDGRLIATAGRDAVIQLHDVQDFSTVLKIDSSQIEVNGLAFSPDNRRLASAGDDGTIRFWSMSDGRQVQLIQAVQPGKVFNLCYSPDGKYLLSTGDQPELKIWDLETGALAATLLGHEDTAGVISLSPDGQRLVSADRSGKALVWEMRWPDGARITQSFSTPGRFMSLEFSPDATVLVGGTSERKLQLWHLATGELLAERSHLDEVFRATFAADGSYLVSAEKGGTITFWTIARSDSGGIDLQESPARSWQAHAGRVMCLAVSADGDLLVSAGEDGHAVAWKDYRDQGDRVVAHDEQPEDAVFLSDKFIATAAATEVLIGDSDTGAIVDSIDMGFSSSFALAASPEGDRLAVGSEDGRIALWEMPLKSRVADITLPENFDVDGLAISPGSSYLAAVDRFSSTGDCLQVWSLNPNKHLQRISLISCNSACFAHRHPWLFASGVRDVFQRWDLKRQELDFETHGHLSSINAIVVSRDDTLVATASDDRLIKIWNAQTGSHIRTLGGHRDEVHSIAFCDHGTLLVSADDSGRVMMWNVETGHALFDFQARQSKCIKMLLSDGAGRIATIGVDADQDRPHPILRIFDWMSATQ